MVVDVPGLLHVELPPNSSRIGPMWPVGTISSRAGRGPGHGQAADEAFAAQRDEPEGAATGPETILGVVGAGPRGRGTRRHPALGGLRPRGRLVRVRRAGGVTGGGAPSISVVVPTVGRPRYLERCLGALAASQLAPDRFEVVVVDDSRGPEVARVAAAASVGPQVVRPSRTGPSGARNAAPTPRGASFVAFTDDDCGPPGMAAGSRGGA